MKKKIYKAVKNWGSKDLRDADWKDLAIVLVFASCVAGAVYLVAM